MPVGGLLSGFIGGAAAGIDDVAKLSLEERAQKRKDDLAEQMARLRAAGKGKGVDKTPGLKYGNVDLYDEDGNKTGVQETIFDEANRRVLKVYKEDEINPYLQDISTYASQYDMSPTEIARELERQGRSRDPDFKLPPGLVEYAIFQHQIPRGGKKPPVKTKPIETQQTPPTNSSMRNKKKLEAERRKQESQRIGENIGKVKGYEDRFNM
jgi:hypothetical protein